MRRVMLIGTLILVALVAVAFEAGEPLFVQIRETELRSSPGFLSTIERRLSFGDEVSYLGERSGWIQVTLPESETTGWVHAGAMK
ncbi:MAG: SH3 domain-containing protein, partial [Spirochaetota bacterium]